MTSKQQPPAFPVPVTNSPLYDDLSARMRGLNVGPPSGPPPGWAGGFNLPISTLSQHDPYLSQNRVPGRPQPNTTSGGYTPPDRRGSPAEMTPAPAMPVPSPYLPSSSDPALPSINQSTKPSRRSSTPRPIPSSSADPASPAPKRPAARRRSTATDAPESQCAGTTKAGKRCTRVVKNVPPISMYVDSLGSDGMVERYCHQHRGEMMAQTGYFSKKSGVGMIEFSEWISEDLQEDTQVLLKTAMEQPVSASDTPGQIYCFQILNKSTPDHVHFKVGRSNNFIRRTGEWNRQCVSHEQILRGVWPEDPTISTLKGRMGGEGKKAPYCHRLEKLIHIELADRANNPRGEAANGASTSRKGKIKAEDAKMSGKVCECGIIHKEIFTFPKATGSAKEQEWQDIVFPVMRLWGRFVENCL